MNHKVLNYIKSFLGYNSYIKYHNNDEFFFSYFKDILTDYSDFFSLGWYMLYLRQRKYILPLFIRGIRFFNNLPCRGQRTHSNYNTSKRKKKVYDYLLLKKKLNDVFIKNKYPG